MWGIEEVWLQDMWGGTHIVSSAADVLGMSGVWGVYEMCMHYLRAAYDERGLVWALRILWDQGVGYWTCVWGLDLESEVVLCLCKPGLFV